MNVKFVLLAGLLYTSISSGQQFTHPLRLTGGDFVFEGNQKPRALPRPREGVVGAQDTFRLLAIMVQFQADSDPRTTGTGRFDLSLPEFQRIIDPPPRDRFYFLNHLRFLENYYRKVSDGKIIIQSELLPDIITLSKLMESYSPPREGPNRVLGDLLVESWDAADSLHPEIDFSTHDVFAVFHAGAGRDIDLVSILGFDPTPLDIPSVFVGLEALKSFYGEDYRGIPVDGGSYFIDHSMILPETENRTIPSLSGDELLQLSINGLLCASFGSYLGLPDLFDTRTGRTAIGRFGLMDGQSIFSFSGLFPPEPSAWEKLYLGWVNPIVAPPGTTTFMASAVGLDASDSTTFRVPISAREYFLVENRNRDPQENGQRVTMIFDGQSVVKTFARDTVGFNAFDVREVYGVVTDVEDYDWSLPGGVSESGEFFNGGILIWHIDENIIEANLPTNTVNADPRWRGVDLEEADGSQDLGQEYGFLSPGAGSEEGTPLDFWYRGNTVPVYRNEFSATTHPKSLSNTLANSLVTIHEFSARGVTMTFEVQLGDLVATPLQRFPKFVGRPKGNYSPQVIDNKIYVSVNDTILAYTIDGLSARLETDGLFSSNGASFPITLVRQTETSQTFAIVRDSSVFAFTGLDEDGDGRFESVGGPRADTPGLVTTSPLVEVSRPTIVVGTDRGFIAFIYTDLPFLYDLPTEIVQISSEKVSSIALITTSRDSTLLAAVTQSQLHIVGGRSIPLPLASSRWEIVGGKLPDGSAFVVVSETGGSHLLVFDESFNLLHSRGIDPTVGPLSSVGVADVDGNGIRDVIFAAGNFLNVITPFGVPLDYFPVHMSGRITGDAVIADLNGDAQLEIVITTDQQHLVAIDRKGKTLAEFPLVLDGINRFSPVVFAMQQGATFVPGIVITTDNGFVSGWLLKELPTSPVLPWASYRGNTRHTAYENSAVSSIPISSEFFPESRAYNWPNPVYDGKTNIRYYLGKDSAVRVKIFDLAGDLVEELSGPGIGGVDNEVEWDVSKIQSGIYLARIEASSGTETASTVIKIAVVK